MTTRIIDPTDHDLVSENLETVRGWYQESGEGLAVSLVYGGLSAEDQLYITNSPPEQMSVTALSQALTQIGARFTVLDPCSPTFIQDLTGYDVVLSNLHGPFGEDGRLQGLLDYLRVPYGGSGMAASAVASDKVLCKQVMRGLGVPTPAWQVPTGPEVTWTGQPVMVKPRAGGSSIGMSLVRTEPELLDAIERAMAVDPTVPLVEQYIPGLPVTVGMLELPDGVLIFPPLATKVRSAEFYDANAKLDADRQGIVICTMAGLPAPVLATLTGHCAILWDGLGCRGIARIDFIVTDEGEPYALEVNTTPGMSRESNFMIAAGLCGIGCTDVVRAILREALCRRRYDVPLPKPVFTSTPGEQPG